MVDDQDGLRSGPVKIHNWRFVWGWQEHQWNWVWLDKLSEFLTAFPWYSSCICLDIPLLIFGCFLYSFLVFLLVIHSKCSTSITARVPIEGQRSVGRTHTHRLHSQHTALRVQKRLERKAPLSPSGISVGSVLDKVLSMLKTLMKTMVKYPK